MNIDEKYRKYLEIFDTYFIKKGNHNDPGTYIPLAEVNFDTMVGTVGDGTINMAHYLTYLYLIEDHTTILKVLLSLYRLNSAAYNLFRNPNIYMPYEPGFFIRDDISSLGFTHLKNIHSGYSSVVEGFNEDPCYSLFTSQDQVWNLLPILSKINDITATIIGHNMAEFIVKNNHVIYNPYLSAVLHHYTYVPTFGTNKVKPWERIVDRDRNLKYTVKVKRGAYNWYFAYGFKKAFQKFGGYCKTFWSSLWYKPFVFLADRVWAPYICKWFNIEVKNTSYYALGITSGAWYFGNVDKRIVEKFNKSLKGGGELFLPELAVLSKEAKDINIYNLSKWVNAYPEPSLNGKMQNPITFMILYTFYQKMKDA